MVFYYQKKKRSQMVFGPIKWSFLIYNQIVKFIIGKVKITVGYVP